MFIFNTITNEPLCLFSCWYEPVCLITSVFVTVSSTPGVGSGFVDAVLRMTARTRVVNILADFLTLSIFFRSWWAIGRILYGAGLGTSAGRKSIDGIKWRQGRGKMPCGYFWWIFNANVLSTRRLIIFFFAKIEGWTDCVESKRATLLKWNSSPVRYRLMKESQLFCPGMKSQSPGDGC